MKELIIEALTEAIILVEKQIPETKKSSRSISILDVKPIDLLSYMKDNNVPDDAEFDGKDNGDDGWNDILLSWYINVPTTDKDKLKYKKTRFNNIAWKKVYELLINNGYKRVPYNTGLLKEFDNITVYDMFINNEFDRLVTYYSLAFNLIETN